ncbi:hypothetical protein CPA46_17220 [Sphingopyxis terrae subsp. ummariensis]|uniref:Uncharacterized protein n=2 Tax=Sphingopyxis terrae TaxID=33052 RepID=A0A1Y6G239_9SPHN|nr:hypothetical protein CPA46_17220 [Sphingopyxis terrae subsp. ummariensis]SMQ79529.1 hypothetical protein SAMN06295984_3408 [Sphingopyxis terrae subsp. ummariensis]
MKFQAQKETEMNIRTRLLESFRTAASGAALLVGGAGMALVIAPVSAIAQDHGSHQGGTDHQEGGQTDHGSSGQRGGKARAPGEASDTAGHRSMEDIFRDVADTEQGSGRPAGAGKGSHGSSGEPHGEEEEDSDRPAWAGGGGGRNDRGEKPGDAGSTRGDLYGDMYVILRDANGVPILNAAGFVQPIDANGNLIPLDAEGAPIDPSLAIEVEMGRLNVGRAPDQVLDNRAAEVVTLLNSATAITTDAAGRLVVTSPDGTKTIDAPLENLALYVALMTTGTIPGVTDLPGTEFDHLVDGVLTAEDMVTATSLMAGAADKAASLTPDAVAYMNAILGIDTQTAGSVTWSDVDYSSYSYDRSDTYGDVTATVLIKQADGSYVPTEVNIFTAVFGSADYSGTGTFNAFATAVDDARAVVNYIHEYEVPADLPTPQN